MNKTVRLYLARRIPEDTMFVSDEDNPRRINELAFKFIEEESKIQHNDSIEVIEIVDRSQVPKEWAGESIVWGEEYLDPDLNCEFNPSGSELTIDNYFSNKDIWENNNEERIKELKAQRAKIDEEIKFLESTKRN